MAQIIKEISVDVSKLNNFILLAKQGDTDSRFYKVTITDNGTKINISQTASVTFNVRKPGTTYANSNGTVNEDGTATVGLTHNMLELDGTLTCDISVIETVNSTTTTLTTTSFAIKVEASAIPEDVIVESDDFSSLQAALAAVTLNNTKITEKTSYGIVSGGAITPSSGLTVSVAAMLAYLPNGLRYLLENPTAKTVNAANAFVTRTDAFYISTDLVLTYLPGTIISVAGTRIITFSSSSFEIGDTVAVEGVTFTYGTEFIGTLSSLVTAINANATINALYTATLNGLAITMTENVAGGGHNPGEWTVTSAIVTVSYSGIVASSNTSTPAVFPADCDPLYQLVLPAGTTTITTAMLIDKRITLKYSEGLQDQHKIYTLQNGVCDRYDSATKTKTQKVQKYILQASDITAINTWTYTNVDYVTVKAVANHAAWTSSIDGNVYIDGYPEITTTSFDVSNAKVMYTNLEIMWLMYPKGTYANLAAAQAALAGTVIYYQLATPVTIQLPASLSPNTIELIRLSSMIDKPLNLKIGTFATRPTSLTQITAYLSTDKVAGNVDRLTISTDGVTWYQL